MRKILASFLAASMVMSIGMTSVSAASTNATSVIDMSAVAIEGMGSSGLGSGEDDNITASSTIAAGDATLTLSTSTGNSVSFTNRQTISVGDTADDVAQAFAGAQGTMRDSGIVYTFTLAKTDTGELTATISPAGSVNFTITSMTMTPVASTVDDGELQFTQASAVTPGTFTNGSGGTYDSSNQTIDIEQVVYCDTSGTAIPLVEDKDDLNGQGDGVRSSTTIYFLVNEPFDNDTYFKLKASKGNNSKNIKSIDMVSKYFTNELYNVYSEKQLSGGLTTGRHTFIKVELNELYTDDEYKITFDLKVSLTSSGQDKYPDYEETSIKGEDISAIWLKNKVDDGDGEYRVGESGLMISPLENDWNEIVWYDEESDLARLYFFADSDVSAFYSKLSTKWEHADYASYFNDQDAYIFDFTGSPSLSSTSRADLEIYNPFMDEDGNETIDPESAVIYQVIDGDLYDVTDSFTYEEGDSGEMAYRTRTRFLGTYIICEKPVEEAMDDSDDTDYEDLVPEDTAPEDTEDTTPEADSGAKQPANTGKYN